MGFRIFSKLILFGFFVFFSSASSNLRGGLSKWRVIEIRSPITGVVKSVHLDGSGWWSAGSLFVVQSTQLQYYQQQRLDLEMNIKRITVGERVYIQMYRSFLSVYITSKLAGDTISRGELLAVVKVRRTLAGMEPEIHKLPRSTPTHKLTQVDITSMLDKATITDSNYDLSYLSNSYDIKLCNCTEALIPRAYDEVDDIEFIEGGKNQIESTGKLVGVNYTELINNVTVCPNEQISAGPFSVSSVLDSDGEDSVSGFEHVQEVEDSYMSSQGLSEDDFNGEEAGDKVEMELSNEEGVEMSVLNGEDIDDCDDSNMSDIIGYDPASPNMTVAALNITDQGIEDSWVSLDLDQLEVNDQFSGALNSAGGFEVSEE